MEQGGRVGEVEHPEAARGDGDQQPDEHLDAALGNLRCAPRRGVELDTGVAVALDLALHPDVEVGPHRLRAGVAAPGAAEEGGDEEQPDAGHDEQARDVIEFLRPDLDEEEIEAAVGHVDEDGLVRRVARPRPAQPGRDIVDAEEDDHHRPLEAAEPAVGRLRVNRFARGIERAVLGLVDRCRIFPVDFVAVDRVDNLNHHSPRKPGLPSVMRDRAEIRRLHCGRAPRAMLSQHAAPVASLIAWPEPRRHPASARRSQVP